jgi:hypothetical protein
MEERAASLVTKLPAEVKLVCRALGVTTEPMRTMTQLVLARELDMAEVEVPLSAERAGTPRAMTSQ